MKSWEKKKEKFSNSYRYNFEEKNPICPRYITISKSVHSFKRDFHHQRKSVLVNSIESRDRLEVVVENYENARNFHVYFHEHFHFRCHINANIPDYAWRDVLDRLTLCRGLYSLWSRFSRIFSGLWTRI